MRALTLSLAGFLFACTGSTPAPDASTDTGADAFVPEDRAAIDVPNDFPVRDGSEPCGDASCSATQGCQPRVQCSTDPSHPMQIELPPVCVDLPVECTGIPACRCPGVYCPNGVSAGAHCLDDGGIQCGTGCI